MPAARAVARDVRTRRLVRDRRPARALPRRALPAARPDALRCPRSVEELSSGCVSGVLRLRWPRPSPGREFSPLTRAVEAVSDSRRPDCSASLQLPIHRSKFRHSYSMPGAAWPRGGVPCAPHARPPSSCDPPLAERDPEIARLIQEEEVRETVKLRLIPSENYASRAVLEATGSVLTNKYSEGTRASATTRGSRSSTRSRSSRVRA